MSKPVYQPKPKQPFIPKNSPSNKKKKKNTFLFYVLIFAFIFWSIGSTLALISFFRNIDKDNQLNIVKADYNEPGQYIGSNLTSSVYLGGNYNVSPDYVSGNYNFNFRLDFRVSNNKFIITNSDFFVYVPDVNSTRVLTAVLIAQGHHFALDGEPYSSGSYINYKISENTAFSTYLNIDFSGSFNGLVSHIVISSTESVLPDYDFYNFVTYYDTNGDFVKFSWLVQPVAENYYVWSNIAKFDYRLYYLSTALENNNDYQIGYDAGYNNGINDNQQNVYDNGYKKGYDNGNTKGYSDGYSAGVESANSNTFTNLLFSVVDAPIRVISDILSFEVLGTDLSNIFFMLVSCSVIMFIIKRFI